MASQLRLTLIRALLVATTAGAAFDAMADGAQGSASVSEKHAIFIPLGALPATSDEIPALKDQAIKGSSWAAFRVAGYYTYTDEREHIYWLMIAAENGDPEMRFQLAYTLRVRADLLSKARARYWYERIMRDGPPEAAARAKNEVAAWELYEKKLKENN